MDTDTYGAGMTKPAYDLSAKWYKLEANRVSSLDIPLEIVHKRLSTAFHLKDNAIKTNITTKITFSGRVIGNRIDASFLVQDERAKTEYYVQGYLFSNLNNTTVKLLVRDELQIFFLFIQPLMVFMFVKFLWQWNAALFISLGFALYHYIRTKSQCSTAASAIAASLRIMASTDHAATETTSQEQSEPERTALKNTDHAAAAKKSFRTGEYAGLFIFLAFWITIIVIIPKGPDESWGKKYVKCTITRSEGYGEETRFWICYRYDERTYNIRMMTPMGKNYVGSQVFIRVDEQVPEEPVFLTDQPVPDCLLKTQQPATGWEKIPECK